MKQNIKILNKKDPSDNSNNRTRLQRTEELRVMQQFLLFTGILVGFQVY